MVFFFGKHLRKSRSSLHIAIVLNIRGSEYYAAAKGGAHALGVEPLMTDRGLSSATCLKVKTDCAAAKGFACRR
eukprot:7746054-Pyramimonas_sp.AAC.1